MKLGKKGTEYSLFLVVIMTILVVTTVINMWGKFNDYKERVGTTQFYLMNAYEDGEVVQHYIDMSARQVLNQGLYYGSLTGFMYGLECGIGEYYGYKVINSNENSCAPSVSTKLILYIKETLPSYVEKFHDVGMPPIDYEMLFSSAEEGFTLYGAPNNNLKIEIEPEFRGKCCVGATNQGNLYFSVSDGECYENFPEILTSYRSIREVDEEFCINREDIVVTESPFVLRNPPTEEQEIIQGSTCGDTIVKIAEKGLGQPYCMGSGEWDSEKLPPEVEECPPLEYTSGFCSQKDWEEITKMLGKCPIDCSSFTKWVYNYYANQEKNQDYTISVRNADWQAKNIGRVVDHDPNKDLERWEEITPTCSELQKGDLVFFAHTYDGSPPISHVGIYYGECKFIHAGDPVDIANLTDERWRKHYIGAKRVCYDINPGNSRITGRVVDVSEDEEITETNLTFIPKAEEEQIVFEQFESCDITGGNMCSEDEICLGPVIQASDTINCCIGECREKSETREIPKEKLPQQQKDIVKFTETGNEYVPSEFDEDFEIINEKKNTLVIPIIISLLVTLLIVLGFFYLKKKKIIVFSALGVFVVLAFAFLLIAQPQDNQITGKVTYEQLSDQQKQICQIANAYGVPGNLMLGIADIESTSNHYRNGDVLISSDGGVGIMQITSWGKSPPSGPLICGNSEIDGRKLDARKLEDNIECGVQVMLVKCNGASYICSVNSVCECNKDSVCTDESLVCEYDCAPKGHDYTATYSGFDLAIRGYNGWACGPTEANRRYVEIVHDRVEKYQDACPNDIEWDPSSTTTKPVDELTETLDLAALSRLMKELSTGFYFINPEINEEFNIDLASIHNDLAFASNELITETLDCAFYDYTCEGKLPKNVCLDSSGNYQSCNNDGEVLECYSFMSSLTTPVSYNYECKLQFDQPLCIGQSGQEKLCKEDGQEMKCRDLSVTYKECAQEVIDENGKDNWNIDYCKSSILESECYEADSVWDGSSCIEKPDNYEDSSTLKFCIETGETVHTFVGEEYSEVPLNVKFAVTMHSKGVKEINDMEYLEPSTLIQPTEEYNPGTGETYEGSYMDIYNNIKAEMGGTYDLYTDCTNDINENAWCWVHSGCHGIGIYCKRNKLESASTSTLNTLFRHELTHNIQHKQGGCSGKTSNGLGIRSEWGAEYNSGSKYYQFKLFGNWLSAQQLAQVMIDEGCPPSLLQKAAICNSAAYAEMSRKGCLLANGEIAENIK